MFYVKFMKNFCPADSKKLIAVRLTSASWDKNICSYFLDKVYVEFMKYFNLADSNEDMAVRLISVYWVQKRLILTF